MYHWTPDSIRFRIDAAEQIKYDDAIIAQILPHLPINAHICDAGCGLGYTSIALAKHCARVTAVDTSLEALSVLRQNIKANQIENIEVVEGDLFSMRPAQPYDAMLFCFFGRVMETLRAAKAQCRGTVFLVKKNWRNHRFTPGEVPLKRFTFQQTLIELDALNIPYRAETFSIEMGQPFRSLEDATTFFETYRQEDDDEDISPDKVKRLLCANDSEVFPYFLPSSRMLGIVAIDGKNIPDNRGDSGNHPVSK